MAASTPRSHRTAGAVKQGYTGFQDGDVVIAKITPCFENGKGAVAAGLLNGVGYGTTELHVLRSLGADTRWLFYVTQSNEFKGHGEGSMYGAGGQKRVPAEFVRDFSPLVPAHSIQKAIADFLDRKTAAIDGLIEKKQQLLALLAEKRAALINQAVTKGLDPTVPMKDSGIPWIGEIPSQWQAAPLYARYRVQLGKMLDSKRISGEHLAPYLRNVDVQWDKVNLDDLPTMDFEPADREKFALKPHDLLVCEGGEIGRTAIWDGALDECYYQKAVHRVRRAREEEYPRFMYYVLRAAAEKGVFVAGGNPNTFDHLTADKLRSHRFPFPNAPTQRVIADFLDRRTAASDALVEKEQVLLMRLTEYRQALITAAVSGQLDIGEAA